MADMTLKDAAAYVRTHAQQLNAVITIADRIGEVELIDQQITESEKALASKRDELAAVQAEVDAASAKLEDAEGGIDDAKQTATEIIAKANTEAAGIVAKGKSDAQSAADAVAGSAAKALAGVQGKIETARGDLDALNGQISDKRKALADLEAQATDAEGRAQKARDFIASLKG